MCKRAEVLYRDQQAWRDLQQHLPERLRLTDETASAEEFWQWRGNRIHLDRYANPDAPAKIVQHHGVGTNGRQMSLIVGAPLARRGFETVALDNLGYGLTQVKPGTVPTYEDWVDLVVDFLAYEQSRDDRPIVLYGLSAGGMLTYHVAAKAPKGTLRGIESPRRHLTRQAHRPPRRTLDGRISAHACGSYPLSHDSGIQDVSTGERPGRAQGHDGRQDIRRKLGSRSGSWPAT